MENLSALEQARLLFTRSWEAYGDRRYDEAEALTLQAKEIWERELGPDCLQVSTCLNNLGRLCEETDRTEEGIALHRAALEIRLSKLGDHPETAFCYGNLGTALAANGQFEEAAQMLNAAIACFEKCGETNGHDVEGYRQNLVICLEAMAAEAGIC